MAQAVAMTLVVAAALLTMAGCDRKPVMAHAQFKHLPDGGWQRVMPLTFSPEYDDSAAVYDLSLVVRHYNSYRYSNLSLVVDVIAEDSTIDRHPVDMVLADEFGNWSGGGFGSLYQDKVALAHSVSPARARSIVVWQSMGDCDTLQGLSDIGILATPH